MTLNLKLVRHQDGKWTALPPETDDLPQVPITEKSAPINPAQLLNALDSLLSPDGGIRSIEDVPKLASVMKKFSKKFVSRCVYCNVLQATKSEILSEYLDKGGWEIINSWLQDAKSSSSDSFLIEMLKLCKLLPMTVSRLKENNTGKLIKSLMKHEKDEIKSLSSELVNRWMSMIKEKSSEMTGDKKKKKDKSKVEKDKLTKTEPVKDEIKTSDKPVTGSKEPNKLKGVKRLSAERENKTPEIYEDVKIDPEPLIPVSKKPRTDRPKTAKIYQKKFRATGLEEETPLPKNISKKTTIIDKSAVAAVKNALKLNSTSHDRVTEKKIKPESLMTINENANTKGIKLTPPKPRPTYVLQESGSFMDALMSQPDVPIKRKKKVPPKTPVAAASPTSPTITLPNFQFYKDTLEMNEENKKEEGEKVDTPSSPINEQSSENSEPAKEENIPMDTTEEGGHTPTNDESNGIASPSDDSESKNESSQKTIDPNQLRSILSYGRRKGKKKSVRWPDDRNIKQICYFEMDDTERVNVSRNFYDLKSIEMKREREAMEMAKRHAGDRVEELRRWWTIPVLIDLPPPLAAPGCNSEAKNIEIVRQQATLQEIYFTREMIPESPHEPDLEIIAPKEPKVIPLDEDNVISSVNDYSNYKPVKPASLPEILSSLMKLNPSQVIAQPQPTMESMQIPMEPQPNQSPLLNSDPLLPQNVPLSIGQPYEPGPEPLLGNSNSLLGHPPAPYLSPENHSMELQGEWRTPQDLSPNEQFYGGYPPLNQNVPQHQQPPGIGMRPPSNNIRSNYRGAPRGPPSNVRPPRSRAVCRHFVASHCRFGMNCTFRHPGVNCPL